MTNTQQALLEPTSIDQPQEDVQLTELRPVEHSRIKLDDGCGGVGGNAAATDGLRALRSFSRRQLDEFDEQFNNASSVVANVAGCHPRKRRAERWRHLNGAVNEFGVVETDEDEECAKKINGDSQDKHADKIVEQVVQGETNVEDEEYYGVNGDFEYLEHRNRDEIYVYQQRESCPTPEIERTVPDATVKEAAKEETIVEPAPKPPALPAPRPRGRPRKNKAINAVKTESPAAAAAAAAAVATTKTKVPEKPIVQAAVDESAKELQSKINDIIEANYLMEQENNNVIQNGHGKLQNGDRVSKARRKGFCGNIDEDSSKKYSCMVCNARFKGSGGLRNHYKIMHSSGPLFKCDDCGKEFPLKERLKLHVRIHTGFKPYKCSDCDKTFARGGQLVQHRRTHSQDKPFNCDLCSGAFTCAANLALHLKRHNGQKDHKCEICGRGFVRRDALKKHMECLHRDVKSFLCKICNKTFKGHLPQHMRTHAQDKPHGCATCGQRFAQKSQLTVHQRTHSGQRPFRCLVCWQAFAHSTALKLHTRRHTGERPFKCTECSAGFTQLPHWKKHMKCIHGRSEPYCCKNCNSFFRIKNDLEAHEKDCPDSGNAPVVITDPDHPDFSVESSLSSPALAKYRIMSIEKMRLLLAVLLKRISKQERLDELGFGKRLIDDVLIDSLKSAGKEVAKANGTVQEFEALRKNLAVFLEWTVPKEHWESFQKLRKTPEEVLETLTAT